MLRDGSGHRGESNGVCWRSCVNMRKVNVKSYPKKLLVFFFELLMKTRSFSSARLLGVDRFWGLVNEDV